MQSLANRATAIAADDVGGKAGFIDKQQMIDIEAVLAAYLPFTETVTALPLRRSRRAVCRDPHDQMFIDLASVGRARVLVTGDADLLALTGDTLFAIEPPGEFLKRFPAA